MKTNLFCAILTITFALMLNAQELDSIHEIMTKYQDFKKAKDKSGMLSLLSNNWFVVDTELDGYTGYSSSETDVDFYIQNYTEYDYAIFEIKHIAKSSSAFVTVFESGIRNGEKVSGIVTYAMIRIAAEPWFIITRQVMSRLSPITSTSLNTAHKLSELSLNENYPNPFNPNTKIKYSIPNSNHVTITIYNDIGQYVTTIVNEMKNSGDYEAIWDGKDDFGNNVSSGVYFYKLRVGENYHSAKKMIKLK